LALLAAAEFSASAVAQETAPRPDEQVRVAAVQKHEAEGYTILVVEIHRPDDIGEMSVERWRWMLRAAGWPRVAELTTQPPQVLPCYLEFNWSDLDNRRVSDPLTFVGRCASTSAVALDVTFRYPRKDGTWGEVPLRLDLSQATPLRSDAGRPPLQRWATAQAGWFRLLADYTGDLGGFFTYAAQQTVRKYQVSGYQPPQPIRQWEGRPQDQLYCFGSSHKVTSHVRMSDRNGPTLLDLPAKQRHHATGASKHVAEPHGAKNSLGSCLLPH
jgi:hypothetical protein